ncbi:hypothetical protein SAMN05216436_12951 [bacterium A37T11]|nr:hypothetical protein SAMN05216436_12951 [bacterium A37T11]
MGLFNFRKKNKDENSNQKQVTDQGKYIGDLEKTAILSDLFNISHQSRDGEWKTNFLSHVAEASFACGQPQILQGPDRFPYFNLQIPEPNRPFQCYVVKHIIQDFILDQGIGIAINANKGQPDWVFTYGELINYYLNEEFYSPIPKTSLPKEETLSHSEQVLMGQPSESFLPAKSRTVIRNFLTQQGINDVKIMLMSRNYGGEIIQELVSNLTPSKVGNDHYEVLSRYLKWFLPNHYSFIAMDENSSFKDNFELL